MIKIVKITVLKSLMTHYKQQFSSLQYELSYPNKKRTSRKEIEEDEIMREELNRISTKINTLQDIINDVEIGL